MGNFSFEIALEWGPKVGNKIDGLNAVKLKVNEL
jgi:hypothetical protein